MSVAELVALSGAVLFYVGFLLLLCCHAEGYFDDGCDDGRVACCAALGLMFSGLVCGVVPVVLVWAGLL